jgi:hypothetical protein
LLATSCTNKNYLKKLKMIQQHLRNKPQMIMNAHTSEVLLTEPDFYDRIEQINVFQNYLFGGNYYNNLLNKNY